VPRSIVQRALAEGRPITTENAQDDPRFRSGSVVQARVQAALCVPLLADREPLGVLYLDSRTRARAFDLEDAALCHALAGIAAAALARAHFAGLARRDALARANLERYFAPEVAARIAETEAGEIRPGGARCIVTVLMSDVRDFTRLAEAQAPEVVAAQLSEYLAAMVEVVFAHGGTLDKFIGDALLAFWGAPGAMPDAADRALAAARAMQAEAAALNRRWAAEGKPALGVGIGLQRGAAFAGTIGSPRRLEYTVIGDAVNVAARLSKAAAAGEILIGAEAAAELTQPLSVGVPEDLALRGRAEAVRVYRLPLSVDS
jgi:adenylate cyclase